MNRLAIYSAQLDEVIFENRNKEYGAYVMRKEYPDSLKKSIVIVGSFVGLCAMAIFLYTKHNPVAEVKNVIALDDLDSKELICVLEIEQPKPNVDKTEYVKTPSAAPAGGWPTRIIDNASPTVSVNIDNPVNGQGPPDILGVSATSSVVTTNTTQSIPAVTEGIKTDEAVILAEVMPEFEGGMIGLMKYISTTIIYPESAKLVGKEGTVYVSFVVNEWGDVENAKVIRGIGYGCDEEVLKVVGNMPRWKKAGKNGGHPVKVRFHIPVSFKLK